MKIQRSAGLLVALMLLGADAQGDERAEFVIRGATLELREAGATIQAPSTYWKWSRLERQRGSEFDAYRCASLINDRDVFLLLVSREPVPPLDASRMEDLVSEIRKNGLPENFVIAAPRQESSSLPWPGSFRMQFALSSSGGSVFIYSYAAHRKRAFITLCVTLSPDEPADFTKFSRSLDVRVDKPLLSREILMAVVGIVAAIGVVQWFRSR
jgi:hypothetical protein